MKKQIILLASVILGLGLLPVHAQMGPPGGGYGPNFGGATGKLFGENPSFTAVMELQTTDPSGNVVTMPGKISLAAGKSRFEMNLTEMKGSKMPANASAQMAKMGLDRLITVSRPDKNVSYAIYPGMNSYVENKNTEATSHADPADYKTETTELGRENVEGHPCAKNKVVVTDKDKVQHESTVWNATDLNNFPVKIQTREKTGDVIMQFKKISLVKPDDSLFETPAGYTKYESMQTMMQAEMMKKMGAGMGMPGQ